MSPEVLETFAKLFDEARAVLQEKSDEVGGPDSPDWPAEACAFGALQMFRYLTDVEDEPRMSSEEQTAETARILSILATATRATAQGRLL